MSHVGIHIVAADGVVEGCVQSAKNCANYYFPIWEYLGRKHHGWPADQHGIFGRERDAQLNALWNSSHDMPRPDGILLLATFDLCWFPWSMRGEVSSVMCGFRPGGRPGSGDTVRWVGHILSSPVHGTNRDGAHRGFTFSSSTANQWWCAKGQDHHQIDPDGHACTACGEEIDFAPDLIADPHPTANPL